ncbi:carboxylesterase family protein [Streptomyces sp. TRM66268-LWL]|uniref:Carboxylesterase family protein n=2 Tax=Streptomyces polyasparticus TaxID=2767826 RepID=A0ABR7SN27_9ACTN|nr:carboxylesterase family protein [Streptomyces polyasparticus]
MGATAPTASSGATAPTASSGATAPTAPAGATTPSAPVAAIHAYDPVLFQPVVDGEVLAAEPLASLAAGAAREVDLLVCHTSEETTFLHAVGAIREVATEPELAFFAAALGLPDPDRVLDGYRTLMPQSPPLDRYLALFGDARFAEYTTRLAEQHARAGGRAYASRFTRRRDGARPWHTADIPFAFGNLDAVGAAFLIGGAPDAEDRALSTRMQQAWASFATTGDPGWPPLSADATPVRQWAVPTDHLTSDETSPLRELWRDVPYDVLRPRTLRV